MKTKNSLISEFLPLAAIAGNILFALWILYNGINENFQGTIIEKVSGISLTGLLIVNTFLLIRNRRQQEKAVTGDVGNK